MSNKTILFSLYAISFLLVAISFIIANISVLATAEILNIASFILIFKHIKQKKNENQTKGWKA